ncbi:hypothetical protein MHK_002189 [Candidatus Magnetomorum sp. HK-1]|nr:hypothetical protein MHK_002189 [Candidatus Magnetomorum sp. HK-1]
MSAIQLAMDNEFDDLLVSKIKIVAKELNISFNKLLLILANKMSSIKDSVLEDTLYKDFSIQSAMVGLEEEDSTRYSVKDIKEFF